MFDDPRRRLYEMEQALKAAEQEEIEAAAPVPITEEEPDWLREAKDLLNESATEVLPIHNREASPPQRREAAQRKEAPKRKKKIRPAQKEEDLPEPVALFVEKPPRKGAGGLVILALLELLGMALVVMWWLKWML